jgi:hypothetical protein
MPAPKSQMSIKLEDVESRKSLVELSDIEEGIFSRLTKIETPNHKSSNDNIFKKKSSFAVPGKMPQTQLHHHSSSTNSNNLNSSCSSIKNPVQVTQKNSDADKLASINNLKQNKENSLINVKLEENGNEMPKIRKRICRKMLKILHDEFNLDRKDAKR